MAPAFLIEGAGAGRPTLLLAHGAGAAMDTPWMNAVSARLAGQGLCVARFEFSYMAARRGGGSRRPPGKAGTYAPEFVAAVTALACDGPLIIGGKSMGGRVASLVAEDLFAAGQIAGLLCLGFPFHAPGKTGTERAAHLGQTRVPSLICQGSRDPFGSREDLAGCALSPAVTLHWLEDGDHDLKPRKRVTGRSLQDHLDEMAQATARWLQGLAPPTV